MIDRTGSRAQVTRRALRLTSPLLGTALAMTGCAAVEQDPSWQLDQPRILGISSSQPVLAYPGSLGLPTELSALVVDDRGTQVQPAPGAFQWRLCDPRRPLRDPDRDCGPDQSFDITDPVNPAMARLDFLALGLAGLPVNLLPALLPPNEDASPGCSSEYPHLELPVVLEALVGDSRLVAVKRVRLTHSEFAVERTGVPTSSLWLDNLPAVDESGQPHALVPGHTYRVDVRLDAASLPLLCDERMVRYRAPVRVHVYATAGELSDSQVDIEDGSQQLQTLTWTAPDSGGALFWLVAITDDGAVSWTGVDLRQP